jgi:hypothetical protein
MLICYLEEIRSSEGSAIFCLASKELFALYGSVRQWILPETTSIQSTASDRTSLRLELVPTRFRKDIAGYDNVVF